MFFVAKVVALNFETSNRPNKRLYCLPSYFERKDNYFKQECVPLRWGQKTGPLQKEIWLRCYHWLIDWLFSFVNFRYVILFCLLDLLIAWTDEGSSFLIKHQASASDTTGPVHPAHNSTFVRCDWLIKMLSPLFNFFRLAEGAGPSLKRLLVKEENGPHSIVFIFERYNYYIVRIS